jgi:hypothetical protein
MRTLSDDTERWSGAFGELLEHSCESWAGLLDERWEEKREWRRRERFYRKPVEWPA